MGVNITKKMQAPLSIKDTRKQNHWGFSSQSPKSSNSLCQLTLEASSLLRDLIVPKLATPLRQYLRPQYTVEDNPLEGSAPV